MPVTATPDGRVDHALIHRPDQMCDARFQQCPRCGERLRGQTVIYQGVALQECDNRSRDPRRTTCGQRVMLIPYPDAMVRVIGLDHAEYTAIASEAVSLRTMFERIGMLRPRRKGAA